MLISVVVPAYNRADFIERTLFSIKKQKHRPIELILVDNGSTDNTCEICRGFAELNSTPDFTVSLYKENRKGASAARNCGMQKATGEWISFFDSDDQMSDDFLSDVAVMIKKNPQADVVAAATCIVNQKGERRQRIFPYSKDVNVQILTGQISTQSFVAKTDFVRSIGGWDVDLMRWNDWELGIRILMARPCMVWLKGKAYHSIYSHEDSITGIGFAVSADSLEQALNAAYKDICGGGKDYLFSLECRANILSGLLMREGVKRLLGNWRNETFVVKCLLKALRLYTAAGGRGAWRIALFVSKFLK